MFPTWTNEAIEWIALSLSRALTKVVQWRPLPLSLSPSLPFSHRHPLPHYVFGYSAGMAGNKCFPCTTDGRTDGTRTRMGQRGKRQTHSTANSSPPNFQLLLPLPSPLSLSPLLLWHPRAHPSSIYPSIHRPPSRRSPLLASLFALVLLLLENKTENVILTCGPILFMEIHSGIP